MMINGVNDMNRNLSVNVAGVDTQDISSARLKAMKRSGQVECETCANREYKDGSDEVNVSFKSAAHIDPSAAATKVMAHEQEHVSNANRKAASKDGEVLNATVTLKMAVCPECGRSYVSGGVTSFRDGGNSRDVIILLQRVDDCLHGRDVGVHLRAQLFEGG